MNNGVAENSESSSSDEVDDESDDTDTANNDDTIVYSVATEQSESSFKCKFKFKCPNCNYAADDHVSLYNHKISK